jgi:hypothetical protein
MKSTRLLFALTLLNLGLFSYQIAQLQKAHAQTSDSILRGRGLELVDDQGRMRVQFTIAPGDKDFKMPDGTVGYPETVIFRLITADGKPRVKLTTSDEGSGLMLLGDSDTTHTILQADEKSTSLKLRNNETTEKILKP